MNARNLLDTLHETRPNSGERIDPRTKRLLSTALRSAGLDGNGRFRSPSHGISTVGKVLSSSGYHLEMVTGDILLGNKGQRAFTIYKNPPEGSSPFTEGPEVTNTKLQFVWELLSPEGADASYEVLCYIP